MFIHYSRFDTIIEGKQNGGKKEPLQIIIAVDIYQG